MSPPDCAMNLVSQRHLYRVVIWQSDSCEHMRSIEKWIRGEMERS
jgi:hypothetical protein